MGDRKRSKRDRKRELMKKNKERGNENKREVAYESKRGWPHLSIKKTWAQINFIQNDIHELLTSFSIYVSIK